MPAALHAWDPEAYPTSGDVGPKFLSPRPETTSTSQVLPADATSTITPASPRPLALFLCNKKVRSRVDSVIRTKAQVRPDPTGHCSWSPDDPPTGERQVHPRAASSLTAPTELPWPTSAAFTARLDSFVCFLT